MAFLEGPVSFHMGSRSQQPPARTYEEDAERQETANENRSCLCGLTHTRLCSVCMRALCPAGERSSARGSGTRAVHADTWRDHMTLVSLGAAQLDSNNDQASKTLLRK